MKCRDCPDYKMCSRAYDLRIMRKKCEKAKWRKSITNYDRIISKTPEELADFLWSIGNNPATGNYYLNGKLLFSCADGNGWLDWLKQEANI